MADGPHSPAVAAAFAACNALSQPQRLAVAALIVRDIDDPSCQLQLSEGRRRAFASTSCTWG